MQYTMIGVLLLIAGIFSGCSTVQIDNAMASAAGNKAPYRFYFTAPEKVERWYFSDKNYKALPPRTYAKDWSKMAGWRGVEDAQGSMLALYMKEDPGLLNYAISISSYTGKYGEMQKAIEDHNFDYIASHRKISNKNSLRVKYFGKENYVCEVSEFTKRMNSMQKYAVYECLKFSPDHKKFKSVIVKLIYTKSPQLPKKYRHLAREYTFDDLKRRAKRTLNSLYIKDGWN